MGRAAGGGGKDLPCVSSLPPAAAAAAAIASGVFFAGRAAAAARPLSAARGVFTADPGRAATCEAGGGGELLRAGGLCER